MNRAERDAFSDHIDRSFKEAREELKSFVVGLLPRELYFGTCGRCGGNVRTMEEVYVPTYKHRYTITVVKCDKCGSKPVPFQMQERRAAEREKK